MAEFELNSRHLEAAGITDDDTVNNDGNNVEQGQVQTQETATQGGGTETQQAAASPDQVQGSTGKDSAGNGNDRGSQQGQKKEGKNADPSGDLKPGDIRLLDGTIVRAGAERRHFEQARLFRTENIDLKNQLNTSNQKLNTLQEKYSALESTVKQIGLDDPQSVGHAVRLYKDLRSNPVETAKKLLAELKAAGHNIEGIGGAVDTLAIQQMLEDRMQTQQRSSLTPEQQSQLIQEDAVREATQFFQQFPDAKLHEGIIANIIAAEAQQGREASPRDVYYRLRQSVVNQGFDWGQPLGPQIEARKTASTQQQQEQQQQGQRPIVNGRGGVGGQAQTEIIDPLKSGNNDSKDNIILSAMRDAGYHYQR